MNVQLRDRILDVGCGEGWASRRLASLATEGIVVAVDGSDEMIRAARAQSALHENLLFVWATEEEIPWQEKFFTKALSVDSFDHFENPEGALHEIHRVLAPGGSLWILNRLPKENDLAQRSLAAPKPPAQSLSAEQYAALFARCGYQAFTHRTIPHREPQALLLSARKPPE